MDYLLELQIGTRFICLIFIGPREKLLLTIKHLVLNYFLFSRLVRCLIDLKCVEEAELCFNVFRNRFPESCSGSGFNGIEKELKELKSSRKPEPAPERSQKNGTSSGTVVLSYSDLNSGIGQVNEHLTDPCKVRLC